MPKQFTQATARDRLRHHLIRTMDALPAESRLVLYHPDLPRARFHRGVTLPFAHDGQEVVSEYFTIGYWITGITPDTADRCFDQIVRFWSELGWATSVDRGDPRTQAADSHTPDGYALHLQRSINGYLSLSGWTPPFPVGSLVGDPLPQVVVRPAA